MAELACGPGDLVVDKVRFDAFQWTSLEPLLRGLGVDELVVCGVITNICVETTIRSAFMRDFPVIMLADCCAAATHACTTCQSRSCPAISSPRSPASPTASTSAPP